MTAVRKITEAEDSLTKLKMTSSDKEFQPELNNFVKTMHDVFLHLLDEYNNKFDLKIEKIGLHNFKAKAKKLSKIDAINFLIWYEKEYQKIKSDETCGYLLEKKDDLNLNFSNIDNVIAACSVLLDKTRAMTYFAYENF
ncbi:MAG TPA: hypothetical protein VD828_03450 [Candidatus Nitrosotenuis sp.]|nr:hypothetical protein [Candidatus Nitrosotenuis sp.]